MGDGIVTVGRRRATPRSTRAYRPSGDCLNIIRSEEHTSELQSHSDLPSFPTRRSSDLRCASQEGNALAVCSHLGIAQDPRVRRLAESLIKWQWPDGGWNCDRREEASHSSFNESLSTLWGLFEYYQIGRAHV